MKIFNIVSTPPPPDGTESSFHYFWDANIRNVLELLIPTGRSIRDSNENTETGRLRPDFGFLVNGLCTFRGEEKAPGNTENPKQELGNKLNWVYDPAPYVLGYYATGTNLTLAVISAPLRSGGNAVVHDIVNADLKFKQDRIKTICRLINLSGLLEILPNLVLNKDPEFEPLVRENCTVEIAASVVIKKYTGTDGVGRADLLQQVYNKLHTKQVPNTDSLTHKRGATVILSPRGTQQTPRNEEDLMIAITCILEALTILHSYPPIFHRDIRWPNVIKSLHERKWFLIDWEDAATPPTARVPSHWDRDTHSPRAFVDEHGGEVDIWAVGNLILTARIFGLSSAVVGLGEWMMSDPVPSANEALERVISLTSNSV